MLRAFGHAPCCDMLGVVGSNLNMFKLEPTTPNMSQHGAWLNARNISRPTMLQHVAAFSTKVVPQKCKSVRDNADWYYGW